jgi:glycosyltransferase involved in cell wall biosynthesis
MRAIKPFFVLSYTVKPVIYGILVAYLLGIPKRFAMITGLGYSLQDTQNRNILSAIIGFLYKSVLNRSSKVFFQNPDDESYFRQRGFINPATHTLVINGSGVDLDHYKYCLPPKNSTVFLLIARLLGDKGIREFVSAAKKIKIFHPDAIFQIAGWVDENPNSITQAEVDAWVDEGLIQYLGYVDDVRLILSGCDIYVLPSYREGTPRSVLEAMAMGRPVITTDAPGCRETVVDGDNGFLVPVKDVDALVDAMQKFIYDPSLIILMGARSREIAEKKYDVHKVNAVMLNAMGIE